MQEYYVRLFKQANYVT